MSALSKYDFRLAIPAACAWLTCLIVLKFYESADAHALSSTWLVSVCVVLIAVATVMLVLMVLRVEAISQRVIASAHYVCVCFCAVLCCIISSVVYSVVDRMDIHHSVSRTGSQNIDTMVRISSPVSTTRLRGYRCSVRAESVSMTIAAVSQRSSLPLRVYFADHSACNRIPGERVQLHGRLSYSDFGQDKWVLKIEEGCASCVISHGDVPAFQRVIHRIHQSFLQVTQKLDTQAVLLVPGITMGVMGQDAYIAEDMLNASQPLQTHDVAQLQRSAEKIKNNFRTAGIMHTLAVSGGHFSLVMAAVIWCAKRRKASRYILAVALGVANILVFSVMFPSDSLLRAFIMVFFSIGYVLWGRRADSGAMLCWTIILSLIFRPAYALSMGYALSCVSVLAILLFSDRIEKSLNLVLPRSLAQACAVTLSAQLMTLPLTVMLQPHIPMYSLLSNVLVSIPMDIATVLGLVGLAVAWICEPVGLLIVRMAGWATGMMAFICEGIQSLPFANVSCTVEELCVGYAAIAALSYATFRFLRRKQKENGQKGAFEKTFTVPFKLTICTWWAEILQLLSRWQK
ncbi:ComEC/Rec2 family competence protein [Alloscardovia criceti]|uniref:ComEC/Rec2 family competence protein n=1 Tax=Alloscardovia criceti TaxID=356828 RepID=UPI00037F9E25|nr:ComEC/Rec2 family competence protein [Alloscardovia criceti]